MIRIEKLQVKTNRGVFSRFEAMKTILGHTGIFLAEGRKIPYRYSNGEHGQSYSRDGAWHRIVLGLAPREDWFTPSDVTIFDLTGHHGLINIAEISGSFVADVILPSYGRLALIWQDGIRKEIVFISAVIPLFGSGLLAVGYYWDAYSYNGGDPGRIILVGGDFYYHTPCETVDAAQRFRVAYTESVNKDGIVTERVVRVFTGYRLLGEWRTEPLIETPTSCNIAISWTDGDSYPYSDPDDVPKHPVYFSVSELGDPMTYFALDLGSRVSSAIGRLKDRAIVMYSTGEWRVGIKALEESDEDYEWDMVSSDYWPVSDTVTQLSPSENLSRARVRAGYPEGDIVLPEMGRRFGHRFVLETSKRGETQGDAINQARSLVNLANSQAYSMDISGPVCPYLLPEDKVIAADRKIFVVSGYKIRFRNSVLYWSLSLRGYLYKARDTSYIVDDTSNG